MNRDSFYSFTLEDGHYFSGARNAQGEGRLHSFDDEPAVIYKDGTKWWYENGAVSRRGDLPAVCWWNGVQEWWLDGVRHRDNGPAVIFPTIESVHPSMRGVRQFWDHGVMVREERA